MSTPLRLATFVAALPLLYRLFLQFVHAGRLQAVAFTQEVS